MTSVGEATVAEMVPRGSLDGARTVRIVAEIARQLGEYRRAGHPVPGLDMTQILVAEQPGAPDTVRLAPLVAAPRYRAPEQLAGGPGDERTDVYVLGCVLFEMLTGREPFAPGDGGPGVAPPAVTTVNPWVPAAFDTVVAKALTADPAGRYADGTALATAARAAAAPRPEAGPPPPDRRRRTVAYVAVAVVAVLIAVIAVAVVRRPADPPPSAAATTETRSPELKAALWGSYAYIADAFPDLLPISVDGIGYQGLVDCRPVDRVLNLVSLYEPPEVGGVACYGNYEPVVLVIATCRADLAPIAPDSSPWDIAGQESWTRPSGAGRLAWGEITTVGGERRGRLDVFFDDPGRDHCRLEVNGVGTGALLHDRWWPDAPL
ncbi:hypothetical protein [Nocardia sp. NPDC051750]|uniref:hypothetical protein n=1 Tax=Nocardia sp. NPDC051750 TaxID=3364325 RepID=UPI003796D5D2